MKKNILSILSICFSMTVFAQDSLQIQHQGGIDCGCVPTISDYNDVYKTLNNEDWNSISKKLDTLLSMNLKLSREKGYNYEAWNTLRRIQDIEWTTHKKDVLKYLDKFVRNVLEGKEYLNMNNRNIFYDSKGCPWGSGDPISFPSLSYQILMKLDTKYAVKMINETWELLIVDDVFSKNLRNNIINLLSKYPKDFEVQSLVEKLEQTKIPNIEKQKLQEIKFEYVLSKLKSQSDAWKMIVLKNRNELSKEISIENGNIWVNCITILYDLFGDKLDVNIPLELGEKETEGITKYWLAYASCCLENGNYPKKSNEYLVKRIYKLVEDVENLKLTKVSKQDIDYLNEAYKAFKKWH